VKSRRRLFAQPEEEAHPFREITVDNIIYPIARADYGNLLHDYALDGHRSNMGQPMRYSTSISGVNPVFTARNGGGGMSTEMSVRQMRESQQLYAPNLEIPDGDDYLTRAQ